MGQQSPSFIVGAFTLWPTPPRCPTGAQQPPAAGHLQAWRPPSGYAVPLEEVVGKELPGPASSGSETFLVPWGCRSPQQAQPQEALMDQQAESKRGQDTQPEGGGQGAGAAQQVRGHGAILAQ